MGRGHWTGTRGRGTRGRGRNFEQLTRRRKNQGSFKLIRLALTGKCQILNWFEGVKTSDRNVVVCDFLFAALNCALNFITRKAMMRRHEFVIHVSVGFENNWSLNQLTSHLRPLNSSYARCLRKIRGMGVLEVWCIKIIQSGAAYLYRTGTRVYLFSKNNWCGLFAKVITFLCWTLWRITFWEET